MNYSRIFVAVMAAVCLLMAGCAEPELPTTEPTAPSTEPTVETTEPTQETTLPTEPETQPTPPETLPSAEEMGHFYVDTPAGFVLVPDAKEALRLESQTEGDGSYITVQELPMMLDLEQITALEFWEYFSEGYPVGSTALDNVQDAELFGCPAKWVHFIRKYDEVSQHCVILFVQASKLYMFTFMDATAEELWQETFTQAIDSIQLLPAGQYLQPDTRGLKKYTLDFNLTMMAVSGLKEKSDGGYSLVLVKDQCLMTFLEDVKEGALAKKNLQAYAQSLEYAYRLEAFEENAYGSLVSLRLDADYCYYLTVKESKESFFLCQMVCPISQYGVYREQFDLWAATMSPKK